MREFANTIDELERQVRAAPDEGAPGAAGGAGTTSQQNLPEILSRLHDSFIGIAAEVCTYDCSRMPSVSLVS